MILLGLMGVLPTMPDLVTFGVSPSLVALRFGLGEEIFRGGSSTHRGCRKLAYDVRGGKWLPAAS
jgi:hypothetical protein